MKNVQRGLRKVARGEFREVGAKWDWSHVTELGEAAFRAADMGSGTGPQCAVKNVINCCKVKHMQSDW